MIIRFARLFLASLFATIGVSACAGQSATKSVFKNFEYPYAESHAWPHQMEWLDVNEPSKVTLVNGQWRVPDSGPEERFSGLTLEQVQLGDVTGDGRPEAIVVLRFDTGGTQYSHYVYVFSLEERNPKLLAYFHSGDRAYSGLYKVYSEKGKLVVEQYDPKKQQGDCCSTGIVRNRFEWTTAGYKQVGNTEFGAPAAESRLPVDSFGNHH